MCLIFYRTNMSYRSRVILIKLDNDEGEDENDDVIIKNITNNKSNQRNTKGMQSIVILIYIQFLLYTHTHIISSLVSKCFTLFIFYKHIFFLRYES